MTRERRIRLFGISIEGDRHNGYKVARRIYRNLIEKTKIDTFLFFENENNNEKEHRYEYLVDVSCFFEINSEILRNEIKSIIGETKSALVEIKDFTWIEEVIANFE